MHAGAIDFLTGAGTKFAAACRGAAMAFQIEADDIAVVASPTGSEVGGVVSLP